MDLDVVVADGAVAAVSTAIVADLGGDRSENAPTWHPVFRRALGQRFNDHVFGVSDDGWRVSVATRDVLRARPELRAEYERRKREAAACTDDLGTYSRQKTPIVEELLATAREDEDPYLEFEIPSLWGRRVRPTDVGERISPINDANVFGRALRAVKTAGKRGGSRTDLGGSGAGCPGKIILFGRRVAVLAVMARVK